MIVISRLGPGVRAVVLYLIDTVRSLYSHSPIVINLHYLFLSRLRSLHGTPTHPARDRDTTCSLAMKTHLLPNLCHDPTPKGYLRDFRNPDNISDIKGTIYGNLYPFRSPFDAANLYPRFLERKG